MDKPLRSWHVYAGVVFITVFTIVLTSHILISFTMGALVTLYGTYLMLSQERENKEKYGEER